MTDIDSNTQGSDKKPRILVADDSKLIRVSAKKTLSENFDLVMAEDGEEAWQILNSDDTIQMVFTDIGMPKLDGYGLIQRIRQSEKESIRNQPVIVITGAAEDENVRRRVFELGATDFISKPFKSTELVARAEAHTSYRRDHDTLQKNVDIDLLTGTLNQHALHKQLDKDIAFVNRHAENLAIILFELDNFKTIFERIGKQASDQIIKQVTAALLKAIRKEDSVGRYGLQQFIVILPMAKAEGVIILAKRLCALVESFKIAVGGTPLPVTMSAGISVVRKGTHATTKGLMRSAEQALVLARELGRGQVQILKLEFAQKDEKIVTVSIDALLEEISKGNSAISGEQMDAAIRQLSPLIALMDQKQKQRLTE